MVITTMKIAVLQDADQTRPSTPKAGTEESLCRPSVSIRSRGVATYSPSSRRLRVRFGSTGMPGPVVVETVTFLT